MLRELHISDLGVIHDLDLEVHPGLTVLTGETGAGKTMVTLGLTLATGLRASASLVRPGADAARVQARFDAPADADDWAEEGELILARTVRSDGKSAARIGGQLATVSALAELGEALVEVHGQHQAQRLLQPDTQTAFLDRFAGERHLAAVATCRQAHGRWRDASIALERLRRSIRDREREIDLLAYQVREIEALAPEAGELERLEAEEARLAHIERLAEVAEDASIAIAGDEGGGDRLSRAAASLEEASSLDPEAGELADRARAVSAEAAELGHDLRGYIETLVADPERLHQIRGRIAALRTLRRKYGGSDEEVLGFLAASTARLTELEAADERLAELEAQEGELGGALNAAAQQVSEGRAAAAPSLAAALTAELEELGMNGGALTVALERSASIVATGAEQATLLLTAGAGQPPRPLGVAASGGELSRTMLACRSVLADVDAVPTLVFDEVDAGIGGRAGMAVGRRLARLAATRQVLVVTHLPQIACFADRHVRLTKVAGTAEIEVLDDDERIRELSRMLAGLDRSDSAVSHASELVIEAQRVKAAT